MTSARHVPVLLERCVELLAPALQAEGSVVVDATLGMGGHSEALLTACPGARLVGIDRDPQALALAAERLEPFAGRTTFVKAVYDEIPEVLDDLGLGPVDGVGTVRGVLMDLGVSSLQLDETERGFSYSQDAPLDMRMDTTSELTAAEVLNTYSATDLIRLLRDYGEERFAKRIAQNVLRARAEEPFTTSARLVELVRASVPAATRRTGGNPSKRTFQALRIEVNDELGVLEAALPSAVDALAVGGRIVVMSYQSLEDKLAKRVLTAGATSTTPQGLPIELHEHAPRLKMLTRGAEQAGAEEGESNPRAGSVRLRAAERLLPPAGARR